MTTSRGIAITGGQPFAVSYLLDGAMHNNVLDGLNLPLPFPDALQEFSVETSSQNAQNGRQGSGTVNVVTKAGTNLLHGDLFEFPPASPFQCNGSVRCHQSRNRRAAKRRPRAQSVRRYARRADCHGQNLLLRSASGNACQSDAGRHHHVHPDGRHAGRRFQPGCLGCVPGAGEPTLPAPFVNNQISPALLSPAAINMSRRLPATTDPCGRITFSRQTKPQEGQSIGRVDWQVSQSQSLFVRYMRTTTFWDPAFSNSPDNVLAASGLGAGGRDSDSHSLAVGHTQVLSSTTVNNIRSPPTAPTCTGHTPTCLVPRMWV